MKGETRTVEAHGHTLHIRRKDHGYGWILRHGSRVRWADTKAQLDADVKHFEECGFLPPAEGRG